MRSRRFDSNGHIAAAFSLIELVIVVVIIAIIGAIAIPRMSRGAAGAADAALTQDLTSLRGAIDLLQTENGGVYPTNDHITQALTSYHDGGGASVTYSATPDATHIYGPYLRSIPPLPVGPAKGNSGIGATGAPAATAGMGWVYNGTTGQIVANTTTETDAAGTLYKNY
jgi:prepilin-type N-terminal cleavage/methylation domain-containing protein